MVVLETVVWKPPLSFLLSCDSVVSAAQSIFPTGLDRNCVRSMLAATHAFWGQWESSRFIKLAQVVEFGVGEARKYGGFEGGSVFHDSDSWVLSACNRRETKLQRLPEGMGTSV